MLNGSEQTPPSSEQSSEQEQNARNRFDGRMDRLWSASGTKSDAQFAKVLGIKHQSVSSARARKQLPYAWVVEISEKFNVSSDWLLYGTGPMRREEEARESQVPLPVESGADADEGRIIKPEGHFYPDLLRIVVTAVEKWLDKEDREMEPAKKAELVVMLYELFREKGEIEAGTIEKYLRLVS